MPKSLRSSLAEIGIDGKTFPFPKIRSGFSSSPASLKSSLLAMQSPEVSTWTKVDEGYHQNHEWTEECQGVAWGNGYWFTSSNNKSKKAIYQFRSISDGPVREFVLSDAGLNPGHVGAIYFGNNRIYAAIEDSSGNYIMTLNAGDPGLSLAGFAPLTGRDDHTHNPWCAINPWDGLIYSSNAGDSWSGGGGPGTPDYAAVQLFAYDMSSPSTYRFVKSLILGEGRLLVQGGAFSPSGHIVLSHSGDGSIPGSFSGLTCYSALNGHCYGSVSIEAQGAQEVEGVAFADLIERNQHSQLHVVLLDNDVLSQDDVYIKHYSAPALLPPEQVRTIHQG